MEWMLDIQLGRRNLSPIQRIAVAEKYRPIYEKQAKKNKSINGGDKKSELQNSSTPIKPENKIDVRAKLAETANVSTDTYSKGKKILDSDNDEVKNAVLSGDMSINAGYNKIRENEKNMKKYNKNRKTIIAILGIIVLILPLPTIGFAHITFGTKIWDNPEFWYGYMTYFGTVFLAIISLIQNVNANENNDRFMEQQLRQKIGYFELKKETEERKYINPYQRIHIGDHFTAFTPPDPNDKMMSIWMHNIGEDIILNLKVLHCCIDKKEVEMTCAINTVYKNEEIAFNIDCTNYLKEKCLNIEFLLQMSNVAGITYTQNIYLDIEKANVKSKTYIITSFGTDIAF